MPSESPSILQALQSALTAGVLGRLQLPSEGRVHERQARLLAVDAGGLWFEIAAGDARVVDPMIESGARARIFIPLGMHHLQYNGTVLTRQSDFARPDGTRGWAVRIDLPASATLSPRRKHYRIRLTPGDVLPTLRIWKIEDRISLADRPLPSSELTIEPIDISAGGMRATIKSKSAAFPLQLSTDQRLRIELCHEKDSYLIEARLRHPRRVEPGPDSAVVGIEFTNLDRDANGRKIASLLNKLIGAIQRKQLRERNAA